jgi:hypothetical protein
MTQQTSAMEVVVNRRAKDGFYVYTSNLLPGLYVASRDDQVAYRDVLESIKKLFLLDFGISVQVVPMESYEQFIAQIPPEERAKEIMDGRTADLMEEDGTLTFVIQRAGVATHQ